jgi:hypothetical protein
MINQIENLPKNVIGFTYEGKVTGKDYETILFPVLDKFTKGKKKIGMIFHFTESFNKISLKAIMDDMLAGLKYWRIIERIAIVSDNNKINHMIRAFGFLFSGEMKIFSLSEFDKATVWISKK